jgi:hypothetical protein
MDKPEKGEPKINIIRFIGASIAVFAANQLTDPIIHGTLLGKAYRALTHIWRTDMMSKMWIMVLASIAFAFLFVYIFSKGYQGKGIPEGIRYGVLIGLLMNGVAILHQYAVYPVPFSLVLQWFAFGMIQTIIYGVIAALIYRPKMNL